MKNVSTYQEMAEIIQRPYIDYKGIMILAPIGAKSSQRMMKEIQQDMASKGEPVISNRPRLVPTEYVLEKLNLNPKIIMKMAKETRL